MLVVFNLGWERFDIDLQVSAANRRLNGLAQERGAGCFMIFNFASLGAGEWIIDRTDRIEEARKKDPDFDQKAAEAGVTAEDLQMVTTRPDEKTIDFLRHYHHQLKEKLGDDDQFKAYRDVTEMFSSLRSRGHDLAAVFTGASKDARQKLKLARAIDYFEDRVYGYDSVKSNDLTSTGIYRHAMKQNKIATYDSLIVADSADGIIEAAAVKPMAVVGYLDPYIEDAEMDLRLKEMKQAGAQYAVTGGHAISSMPDFLFGKRQLKSDIDSLIRRFDS